MALDRALGQEELLRDFLARLGFAHEAQDIDLHVGQRSRVREDALLGAREGGVTFHRGADDAKKVVRADIFVNEAVDVRGAGLLDKGNLGHARHDDDAHLGMGFLDAARSDDAARVVLGTHIQKRAGGARLLHFIKREGGIGEGSHDFHVGLRVDGLGERIAQHGLVFYDDDLDHWSSPSCSGVHGAWASMVNGEVDTMDSVPPTRASVWRIEGKPVPSCTSPRAAAPSF